jgi:diacylglycerol kinase (ATP)
MSPRPRRATSLLESFNYAFEGLIHVLRTHRNMRLHFAVAIAVLVAALWKGVNRIELIALILAIAFVLVTEMINSAIEQAVDLATTEFDPLAKLVKDISAGAVLIASVTAVAVGYLVFSHALGTSGSRLLTRIRDAPAIITIGALILTILLVIGLKAWTGRGRPLRGGLPSGHAAIAFSGWIAVTYIVGATEHRFIVSAIMFVMALLVAQTRIEAGVHSSLEVAAGGLLGALTTLAVFQLIT